MYWPGPSLAGPALTFMDTEIRHLDPEDIPAVVALIREFAEFEQLSKYCEVTDERLHEALFGNGAVAEGLVALDRARIIGYALYFPNFSSFRGQCGLYLDDIYVNSAYRGQRVGEAMLRRIAGIAASRGYERIDLMVLDWNTRAADFYLRLGAFQDDEERHFKFTDDAFRGLVS